MTFTPRPYQSEAIAKGVAFLTQPQKENGIEVLPTGSGKSLVIAGIVDALGESCIVFQPSKEILEQNFQKFVAYGYNPAIFSASARERRVGKITLATIGSVVKKSQYFEHVKYIIIDECDGFKCDDDSMYSKFCAALPEARILGVTATPYRLSQDGYGGSILKFLTRTRPRIFSKVIHVVQNKELFDAGYLAKLEYKQVNTGFRIDRLRLNSTGADYTDESVQNHFRELHFSDQIVRCVYRLSELNRSGVLVFTRFVEEAEYVASKITGAAIVTANTPRNERAEILKKFKAGIIPVVTNVGVLTVGFDYPALANVVLARPTRSLRLYYQMTGRALRPHASKESAYIVDMVGLVKRFGKIEDLTIKDWETNTPFVESKGRALTNVYFKETDKHEKLATQGNVSSWRPGAVAELPKWFKPSAPVAEVVKQVEMAWEN